MGVDVARFGDDRTVIVIRQMEKILFKFVFNSLDTMEICGQVIKLMKEHQVLDTNINVDVIGIGAGVVDRLREQGIKVNGVNVAESPTDKEHYINLRAELYDDGVKKWLKTADLTDDEDWYELSNIKYKFNSSGKLQIESKDEMKKRGLSSPDCADGLMLTFYNKIKSFNIASPLTYDTKINDSSSTNLWNNPSGKI
jgi:phage terminase large subunit